MYTIDQLVELYNKTFPDEPLNNISFGKLKEVKNKFNKIRKIIHGKKQTIYIKK